MSSAQNSSAKAGKSSRLPLILLAVVLVAGVALWFLRPDPVVEGNLTGAQVGGAFTLVDETGATVTSATYDGKWRLMYFGFSFCPDICPTDLATLGAAVKQFESKHPAAAAKLQPLFVTVDPERDTPEVVAEYTNAFHPNLIGLTGTPAQVENALKTFRIFAAKVAGTTDDSYTFDHLAVFYLMDPQGNPVEFRAAPTATPDELAAILEKFLV